MPRPRDAPAGGGGGGFDAMSDGASGISSVTHTSVQDTALQADLRWGRSGEQGACVGCDGPSGGLQCGPLPTRLNHVPLQAHPCRPALADPALVPSRRRGSRMRKVIKVLSSPAATGAASAFAAQSWVVIAVMMAVHIVTYVIFTNMLGAQHKCEGLLLARAQAAGAAPQGERARP